MDKRYPGIDEPVILTTERLIVNGIRIVAALTEKRIVLLETDPERIRESIPLGEVVSAAAGENSLREPVITLTFTDKAGGMRSVDLIFVHNFGTLNEQERDRYLAKLKELNVPVGRTGIGPGEESRVPDASMTGNQSGVAARSLRQASEWMPSHLRDRPRQEAPGGAPHRSPYLITGVLVIIVILVIAVAFFAGVFPHGPAPSGEVQPAPVITLKQTTIPTTAPVPVLTKIPPTQVSLVTVVPTVNVPTTGTWVRIDYRGNYTGYVGASGLFTQVNATGEQLIPIPVVSGMIEGSIEKQDGSSDILSVNVFRNGALVSGTNTTIPFGVADIHIAL